MLSPIRRGDTTPYKFTFTDNTTGTPVPLSIVGKKFTLTLKVAIEDADPGALQRIIGPMPNDADSQAGILEFSLTSVETTIAPGKYQYDLQMHDASVSPPYVKTFLTGVVTVLADVTRSDA